MKRQKPQGMRLRRGLAGRRCLAGLLLCIFLIGSIAQALGDMQPELASAANSNEDRYSNGSNTGSDTSGSNTGGGNAGNDTSGSNAEETAQDELETALSALLTFPLTNAEERYLKQWDGRTLVLGVPEGVALFETATARCSMAEPLMRFLTETLGLSVKTVRYGEAELLAAAERGEVDLLLVAPPTAAYQSMIYCADELLLVYAAERGQGAGGLDGRAVGLVENTQTAQSAAGMLAGAQVTTYADTAALLAAVVAGEQEAAVISGFMREAVYPYIGLQIVSPFFPPEEGLRLGAVNETMEPLLALFDRFLSAQSEKEALTWAAAFARARETCAQLAPAAYLYNEGQAAYAQLQDRFSELRYALVGTEGLRARQQAMLTYFETALGLPFVEVPLVSVSEGAELLQTGELQLLGGLPITTESKRYAVFSQGYAPARLLAASPYLQELANERVWNAFYMGIEQSFAPLLKGTAFADQTVIYNTEEELLAALQAQEITGAFLPESTVLRLQAEEKSEWVVSETLSYAYYERLALPVEEEALAEVLLRLMQLYLLGEEAAEQERTDTSPSEQAGGLTAWLMQYGRYLLIGLAICIVGLVLSRQLRARSRQQSLRHKRRMHRQPIVRKAEEAEASAFRQEAVVDLKKGSFVATQKFRFPGQQAAKRHYTLTELAELTGYPFALHYAQVAERCRKMGTPEAPFQVHYTLYADGRRYLMEEEGIWKQQRLQLTISGEAAKEVEQT